MTVYYIPIALSCLGYFLFKKQYIYLYVIAIFTTLLVGLKGDIDKDYAAYQLLYEMAPDLKKEVLYGFMDYYYHVSMEFGFLLLNVCLKYLDVGFNGVFFFHAAVSFLFLCFIARSLNANCYLTFAFLYTLSFIGLWVQIRFGLASLGILASVFLYHQNRKLLAVVSALIAISFHSVSWVFLLVVPIYYLFRVRGLTNGLKISLLLLLSLMIAMLDAGEVLGGFLKVVNERYEAYSIAEGGSRASFFLRFAMFVLFSTLISPALFKVPLYRVLFSMALASVFTWSFAWSVGILYRAGVLLELGYCLFLVRDVYASRYKYYGGLTVMLIWILWRLMPAVNELEPYVIY